MNSKQVGVGVFFGITILALEVYRTGMSHEPLMSFDVINFDASSETHPTDPMQCPGVLSHMPRGRWVTRPLTQSEDEEIGNFSRRVHKQLAIPPDYQRQDGRCGNVTYANTLISSYIRAMCNPRGESPCCYHNRCESRSISECVCKGCYDLRVQKHAEYSSWIPSDKRCAVPEFSHHEVCRILSGSNLSFIGDSLVRHVYTAMLLLVTGDIVFGALHPDAPTEIRKQCKGLLVFTEKVCRLFLNEEATVCNGSVRMSLTYAFASHMAESVQRIVLQERKHTSKSLAVLGIGIHDSYNTARVIDTYIEPLVKGLHSSQSQWPKLLWMASHAPGILKSPTLSSQSFKQVKLYNAKMERYLWYRSIPVFRTANLTEGMMSFDGLHFGRGMNLMKARIIISYIHELQSRGVWS